MSRTIPAFYFEKEKLKKKETSLRKEFLSAKPFAHMFIDGFVPSPVLQRLIREFPRPADKRWKEHGPGRNWSESERTGIKLGMSDESGFGPFTRHFMAQLNSRDFLKHLEAITGIGGLIPDPTYSGGGLHSTGRGGRLMIHTDANRHPFAKDRLHQVLNGILYLNPGWKESYGGHLELWDQNHRCVQRIIPKANRFVLFKTGTRSYHGHPEPLSCPPGRRRNSIAIYYYTLDRPFDGSYVSNQLSPNWFASSQADRDYVFCSMELFKAWLKKNDRSVIYLSGLNPPIERLKPKAPGSLAVTIFGDGEKTGELRAFGAVENGAALYHDSEGKLYVRRGADQAEPEFLFFVEPLLRDPA